MKAFDKAQTRQASLLCFFGSEPVGNSDKASPNEALLEKPSMSSNHPLSALSIEERLIDNISANIPCPARKRLRLKSPDLSDGGECAPKALPRSQSNSPPSSESDFECPGVIKRARQVLEESEDKEHNGIDCSETPNWSNVSKKMCKSFGRMMSKPPTIPDTQQEPAKAKLLPEGSTCTPARATHKSFDDIVHNIELNATDAGEKVRARVLEDFDCRLGGKRPGSTTDWHRWLLDLPIAAHSLYFREYIDVISSAFGAELGHNGTDMPRADSICRGFPSWLLPQVIKDNFGHRPDDPKYNPATVFVPNKNSKECKNDSRHFTPAMEQYWGFKCLHFDKIVFFKVSCLIELKGLVLGSVNGRFINKGCKWHLTAHAFLQIGKFYEIFYIDAFISQRICNLRWMGNDDKPHVGFPETSLHSNAEMIVKQGFKVVVVEQMETPKELDERNKEALKGSVTYAKSKAVRRDICEIYSIGTLSHESMLTPEARVLLSIIYNDGQTGFGFAFCDVSTCKIWVGSVCMDQSKLPEQLSGGVMSWTSHSLSSLLYQVTPVEIIVDQANVSRNDMKIIKTLPNPPHVNLIPSYPLHDMSDFEALSSLVGSGLKAPESSSVVLQNNRIVLEHIINNPEIVSSVVALCRFLDQMLLKQKVLSFARFEIYNIYGSYTDVSSSQEFGRLILDATALKHLCILQSADGSTRGTLLEYLNHTSTAVGLRLLKKWLSAPLINPDQIDARLDVVHWFLCHEVLLSQFRSAVQNTPDVERLLTKVCTRGLQGGRGAVYFADVHSKHFAEFVKLLDALQVIQENLLKLAEAGAELGEVPLRLRFLCSLDCMKSKGNSSTELLLAIDRVKRCLECKKSQWTLVEGVDQEFDALKLKLREVELRLSNHLAELVAKHQQLPAKMNSCDQVRYVHAKYRFEIECPDKSCFWNEVIKGDSVASDVTSSRAGYIRFRTLVVLECVDQLEMLEQQMKDCLYGCQQRLFQSFYCQHYDECLLTIAALAEIDVLSSFAVVAFSGVQNQHVSVPIAEIMCRPLFVSDSINDLALSDSSNANQPTVADKESTERINSRPVLHLLNSRHPIVASILSNSMSEYVTNDIELGHSADCESATLETFFLVTGPNMGGKSTLLRQICLAVIMAQTGCYVPASKCVLSPVDRIFTRIGAYDSILEGKSTFLVELEETALAIQQATSRSLAVFDELGRGTATFDGSAIAFAVAEYLASVVKCRTLFSTHFQILSDELNDNLIVKNVHMEARVDYANSSLTFLYKLIAGTCPQSHGILVAKLAGLPDDIVKQAQLKASHFQNVSNEVYFKARTRSLLRAIVSAVESADSDCLSSQSEELRKRFLNLRKKHIQPTNIVV